MTEPKPDYSIEDEVAAKCDHADTLLMCVHCGKVLSTSEYRALVEVSAGDNVTLYRDVER